MEKMVEVERATQDELREDLKPRESHLLKEIDLASDNHIRHRHDPLPCCTCGKPMQKATFPCGPFPEEPENREEEDLNAYFGRASCMNGGCDGVSTLVFWTYGPHPPLGRSRPPNAH